MKEKIKKFVKDFIKTELIGILIFSIICILVLA